jgi:hypothetical protein
LNRFTVGTSGSGLQMIELDIREKEQTKWQFGI